ncbi:MAG: DUF4249 family protein [Bacteroidota bacterium]
MSNHRTHLFRNLIFLSVVLFTMGSCVDEIDLVPEKDQLKGVAINGTLVKGSPSFISVLVKPIFTFTADSRGLVPVDEVYLLNEQGQQYLIEDRIDIGQYWQRIDPSFELDYNSRYQLKVQLSDGRTYESDFIEILPSLPITSVDFDIVQVDRLNPVTGTLQKRDFIQYNINTPLVEKATDEKALLYWKVFKTNRYQIEDGRRCYTTQSADVNYIGTFDGNSLASDTLNDFPFFRDFIDDSFSDTYYFTVQQENLPLEAYEYWNQIGLSINRDGNMFEPTAGAISTNISNATGEEDDVQGFFYATERSSFTIRICPEDVGLSFRSQLCDGCPCQSTEPPSFWEACR